MWWMLNYSCFYSPNDTIPCHFYNNPSLHQGLLPSGLPTKNLIHLFKPSHINL
jgi:hypothetical protein